MWDANLMTFQFCLTSAREGNWQYTVRNWEKYWNKVRRGWDLGSWVSISSWPKPVQPYFHLIKLRGKNNFLFRNKFSFCFFVVCCKRKIGVALSANLLFWLQRWCAHLNCLWGLFMQCFSCYTKLNYSRCCEVTTLFNFQEMFCSCHTFQVLRISPLWCHSG